MPLQRFALLTDSNHFPKLGAGATLAGCNADSKNLIKNILLGPWQRSGYTKAYLLSEGLNDADNVREKLAEIVSLAKEGDTIVGPVNSSHGTHFVDYITGEKMSCTVCYNSNWDEPRSFLSKLDYQRAFQKLKPGVKVWCFFDSCESGNIGEVFRDINSRFDRMNRWLEPPQEVVARLARLPMTVPRAMPQQVCAMAGCVEDGTCADIQGDNPHGLFSGARDAVLLSSPALPWNAFSAAINQRFAANGDSQRSVPNGPDIPFDPAV